ncbi:MAG: HAMP domain-containing sensor histidine kinase [Candidatus Hatepunaea meridiana]|nr:HAMP domain-containing sensor histidine kinase [Candidatus Hatepunaea meridiana]
MLQKLKSLRLLLILIIFAVFIILFGISDVLNKFYQEQMRHIQISGTFRTETLVRKLFLYRISEPITKIEKTLTQHVKTDMNDEEFIDWLKNYSNDESLIGAGFVWRRLTGKIEIISLSLKIDTKTKISIEEYIRTVYNPEFVPAYPPWRKALIDSLKAEINQNVGFTLFHKDNFPDIKPRSKAIEAVNTVYGIIWDSDYYLTDYFAPLKKEIEDNPWNFGLIFFTIYNNTRIEGDYSGMLLVDANNDTLFSCGGIQLEPYLFQNQKQIGPWKTKIDWSPGWEMYAQDHQALSSVIDSDLLAKFRKRLRLLFLVALIILFAVLWVQIKAREKQRKIIAHISHELRTPVSKVKLFAETLRNDRTVSEEKEDEYLDKILHASDHLSVLIDNTLNLARLDAGKFKVTLSPQNFGDWLATFYKSHSGFLTDAGFESTLKVEPDLQDVTFDTEAMELALRNILDNAVKYSERNKEIEIIAERKDTKRVVLSVKDRGTGIPEKKRKAIFKRFYRIKQKDREPVGGVGLGLSIVKEIVKAHRGKVWCEGREGGGNNFKIELPVA